MGRAIITIRIMPSSPDEDLKAVRYAAEKLIAAAQGEVGRVEEEPVAFGLNALKFLFIWNEALGGTDSLEEELRAIPGVASAEVTDCRRALG